MVSLVVAAVRNMGNFNFSLTHVLTTLHHVEQCCYLSVFICPHIPAMTSHVAYVIYAIITLITTQKLCNITFSLLLSCYAFGTVSFLCSLPFSLLFISMSPYSLCVGSGIKSIEHS